MTTDWIEPIFNREWWEAELIRLDPRNSNNRGSYNDTDLNRVENNTMWIRDLLSSVLGVDLSSMVIKTNWIMYDPSTETGDIPTLIDIERIRTNIETLQSFLSAIDFENIIHDNTMNVEKANILEKNLYLMEQNLINTYARFYKCGTFLCGQNLLFGRRL